MLADNRIGARSSTDRASDYGSEGWEFESLRARRWEGAPSAGHPFRVSIRVSIDHLGGHEDTTGAVIVVVFGRLPEQSAKL